MNIDILELLLGQIPEAIFFSLFIIIGKDLKEKRILFIGLMILQYFILVHTFPYSILFRIFYTFMTFILLKALYKEKAQITDIFLFIASVIILTIFSIPFLFLNKIIGNIYVVCAISKICLFVFLFLIRKYIRGLYVKFFKHWNRNDLEKRKIKSLTLRNISAVVFNLLFVLINFVMILVKANFFIK